MTLFVETYFNIFALIITIITSIVFVTFMLLKKKLDGGEPIKLHIKGLTTITIYELLQIGLLVYVAYNVILRLYIIFLCVSLSMLFYIEGIYIIKYIRYKKRHAKEMNLAK